MECLFCGKEITGGRTDKKFCCKKCKDAYCYSRHANYISTYNRTMAALRENHTILEGLLNNGINAVDISEIENAGFSRGFITSHTRDRHNHAEYWCFDIFYCQSSTRVYNIRRLRDFLLTCRKKELQEP